MQLISRLLALALASYTAPITSADEQQHALPANDIFLPQSVSPTFFSSLERLSRLVDVAYCVGMTGVSPPFTCASRCHDFPSLHLISTWNTGFLSLADSCGYVAVDHGLSRPEGGDVPHSPAIIIAFRGTYSLTNTIVDLSTVPQEYVPYPDDPDADPTMMATTTGARQGAREDKEEEEKCANCTVHAGFLTSWLSARRLVLPALRAAREKHPTYPVHLVGHSLGGAVAALAALELRLSRGRGSPYPAPEIAITTFGEPRVGNGALAEYLDRAFGLDAEDGYDVDLEKRRYRRVTHADDPVPLLPLAEWGFHSHGGEVYIAKAELQPGPEDLRMCRGDEDRRCIAGGAAAAVEEMARELRRERVLSGGGGAARPLTSSSSSSSSSSSGDTARWWDGSAQWLKPWELFFAHRDYFWRLGLCVPGGDPSDWGRERYNLSSAAGDEL